MTKVNLVHWDEIRVQEYLGELKALRISMKEAVKKCRLLTMVNKNTEYNKWLRKTNNYLKVVIQYIFR